MFWRLERADFKRMKGDGTKTVLKTMTCENSVAGIIAYADQQPVGWCSVGPRKDYYALEHSRILKRIDNQPVWSIVCFFVSKAHRRHGVMLELVRGAINHAKAHGARIVEGYPIDMHAPKLAGQHLSSYAGYMGIASVFHAADFVEVGRASETQLIMRRSISSS